MIDLFKNRNGFWLERNKARNEMGLTLDGMKDLCHFSMDGTLARCWRRSKGTFFYTVLFFSFPVQNPVIRLRIFLGGLLITIDRPTESPLFLLEGTDTFVHRSESRPGV